MDLITLKDIYKTYHVGEIDVPVLKGVSLRVGRGELVALMGSSGSGKSTLMNILGCLDRPTVGQYLLDGINVSSVNRHQMAGFRNLHSRTSSLENVELPLLYSAASLTNADLRQRAERALASVGLQGRADHHP